MDLPGNIEDKRERIRVPDAVTLIPIDFENDDLETVLSGHGYRPDGVTVFVWEGATRYLTEAGSGSRLLFTYVRKDFLDGTAMYGADALHRQFVEKDRIWRFGPRRSRTWNEPFTPRSFDEPLTCPGRCRSGRASRSRPARAG